MCLLLWMLFSLDAVEAFENRQGSTIIVAENISKTHDELGWKLLGHHWYFHFKVQLPWHKSRKFCQMYRSDLATFQDDKESDILKEFPSDMWIGASQNSSGHWNWLHTSSVDEAVGSSCGLLLSKNSTYVGNNCQEPQEFVCQKLKETFYKDINEGKFNNGSFGSSRYKFVPYKVPWVYARVICQAMVADLVVITNPCSNRYVRSYHDTEDIWIGLHRSASNNHEPTWVDGDILKNYRYNNYSEETNRSESHSYVNYISYMDANGTWLEEKLNVENANSVEKMFVCQLRRFYYMSYYNYGKNKTWEDSAKFCERFGRQLVTIKNEHEYKHLSRGKNSFWIGGSYSGDDKKFVWIDGDPLDSSNAITRISAEKNCLLMNITGEWVPHNCSANESFVCKVKFQDVWQFDPSKTDGPCMSPSIQNGQNCYTVGSVPKSIRDARLWCEHRQSTLTSIRDEVENDYIASLLPSEEFWIGKITSWFDGVDDNNCWYPRTLRDNNCYLVNENQKTWSEAKVSCVDNIMELVSIKNAAETDAIKSLYPYSNLSWIGAYQSNGTWKWIDGNSLQFTQWENPPDEDCIAVNSSTGVWQGDECDNANSFICMKRFVDRVISVPVRKEETPLTPYEAEYWISYENKEYYILSENVTFNESVSYCTALGGWLIKDTTAAKHFVKYESKFWVDLKFNGNKWYIDNKKVSPKWAEFYYDTYSCGYLHTCGWKQQSCDDEIKAICERNLLPALANKNQATTGASTTTTTTDTFTTTTDASITTTDASTTTTDAFTTTTGASTTTTGASTTTTGAATTTTDVPTTTTDVPTTTTDVPTTTTDVPTTTTDVPTTTTDVPTTTTDVPTTTTDVPTTTTDVPTTTTDVPTTTTDASTTTTSVLTTVNDMSTPTTTGVSKTVSTTGVSTFIGQSFFRKYISTIKNNEVFHWTIENLQPHQPFGSIYTTFPKFSFENTTGSLVIHGNNNKSFCMKLDGVNNWMDEQEVVNAVSNGAGTVVGSSANGSECMIFNYVNGQFNLHLKTVDDIFCIDFVNGGMHITSDCTSVSKVSLNLPSHWTKWTDWLPCDVVCGNGSQSRSRRCINTGHGNCQGHSIQKSHCLGKGDCRKFALVGGSCRDYCNSFGQSCDPLMQTGESIAPFKVVGFQCSNDTAKDNWNNTYSPYFNSETKECVGYKNMPKQINCNAEPPQSTYLRLCHCFAEDNLFMTTWSPWSECSSSCRGTRNRRRYCSIGGFSTFSNNRYEVEDCNVDIICPVHGQYTAWTQWSQCSATCGESMQTRNRTCTNPTPRFGGFDCIGASVESRRCGYKKCPINGEWSGWSSYSGCTKPCNGGVRVKRRYCTSPAPMYGGRQCHGAWNQTMPCNQRLCPAAYVNVTCKFDVPYHPNLEFVSGERWNQLETMIYEQILDSFSEGFENAVTGVILNDARRGSILASFTAFFSFFDSYQLVYLQDSIQNESSIAKLPVVLNSPSSFVTGSVPTGPPSNIHVVSTFPTSLNVSWSEVDITLQNGNIQGYLLFYREKFKPSDPYEVYGSVGYWAEITGLKPGTVYVFRLLAFTAAGNGVASNLMGVKTMETAPSAPPTSLTGFAIDATSIYVQWSGVDMDDMNGDPLGYNVYFNDGYNTKKAISPFSPPHVILNGLHPVTTYVIDVCAFNAVGEGPCEATEVTTKLSAPRVPPLNLMVYRTLHNTLWIKWNSINTSSEIVDAYHIQYYMIERGGKPLQKAEIKEIVVVPSFLTYKLKFLSSNSKYMIKVSGVNIIGNGVPAVIVGETCKCPPHVHANYLSMPPYVTYTSDDKLTGVFPNIIQDMVTFACGLCPHRSNHPGTIIDLLFNGKSGFSRKSNIDRMVEDIDEYTELTFPLSSNPSKNDTLNARYVPIISYPGAVLIIKDVDVSTHVKKMIYELLHTWPIFMFNFFFIIISGTVLWFLEIYFNESTTDFSTSMKYLIGWRQAWYWAYITQTTLGYGDFVAKGKASRLLAVIWIFISLVMTSLLLGALTTAFTAVQTSKTTSIYGLKVAVLSGSFEERLAILRNGKIDKGSKYTRVAELAKALKSEKVEGILVDAYTAGYYKDELNDPAFIAASLIEYPRTFGVVLSGSLANVKKNVADYVNSNQGRILDILENFTEKMEPKEPGEEKSVFDPSSESLRSMLKILAVLLLLFCIFGYAIWWICCVKKKSVVVKPDNVEPPRTENIAAVQKLIDEFHTDFSSKITKLSERIDTERLKLFKDRGSSSLRNHKKHNSRYSRLSRNSRSTPSSFVFLKGNDQPLTSIQTVSVQDIEDVSHDIEGLPQHIEDMSQNIEDIPQDIANVPQDIADSLQNIEDIPQNIEDIPQNIEYIPQNIEDIPQNIEDIPQNIEDVLQDIDISKDIKETPNTIKREDNFEQTEV
ncbi:uncharacterized protein LOC130633709 isoform X2 [Hydractinia symbiolongicarpus]|uniref:uncharacterized protein LOC130633709 isoform X2 n=1 Tax=Hydractinia symbiolongicarpus TaxID=13093 RepID=UPI00254A80F0|nr:uncharacterized protein LOC130633709 isoform X2 [Hydractinia symbiolongicarpus]